MSEHITETPNVKRLERSSQSKVIAGVCGGLGRYFDITPMVFRLALVVLTVLGGAGILVYIAAVLVMPAEGEDASIAERVLAERSDHPARLVALGLVAVAVLVLLSDAGTWPSAGAGWVIVLLVGLAVLWASKERRARRIALVALTPARAARRRRRRRHGRSRGSTSRLERRRRRPDVHPGFRRRTSSPSYELGVGTLRLDLSIAPRQAARRESEASGSASCA